MAPFADKDAHLSCYGKADKYGNGIRKGNKQPITSLEKYYGLRGAHLNYKENKVIYN